MKKKIISSVLTALIIAGSVSFSAFGAIGNGSVAIGGKAFDLDYANDPININEITDAIVEGGAIYVKDFSGKWLDNNTGLVVNVSIIPAVVYTGDDGVETNYDPGDIDHVDLDVVDIAAANAAVLELQTAVAKDLTVEANLTGVEALVQPAKDMVAKVDDTNKKETLTAKVVAAQKIVTEARIAFDAAKTETVAEDVAEVAVKAAETSRKIVDITTANEKVEAVNDAIKKAGFIDRISKIDVSIPDTTPPQLKSISVDKAQVVGGDTVTVKLDVTDDLSGVKVGWIDYDSPSGLVHRWINYIRLVDGKWQANISTTKNDEIGKWKAVGLYLKDNAGNSVQLRNDSSLILGDFEVIETTPDTTPPQLKSISVDKAQVVGGDTVTVTLDVTDDLSGVKVGWIDYDSPLGLVHRWINYIRLVDGKWQANISTTKYDDIGKWKAVGLYLKDNAGNSVQLRNDSSLILGDFEVIGTTPDTTPPQLKSISVDKAQVVGGDTVTVTLEVTDDLSGVTAGWIDYDSPSGLVHNWINYIRLVDGKWQAKISTTQYDDIGKWKAVGLYIKDSAGNSVQLRNDSSLILGDFEVAGSVQ